MMANKKCFIASTMSKKLCMRLSVMFSALFYTLKQVKNERSKEENKNKSCTDRLFQIASSDDSALFSLFEYGSTLPAQDVNV